MALAAFTGAQPTKDQEPAVRRKSSIALILLLPGVLYLVLFFLTPLISLIITSFQSPVVDGDIGQYQTAFQWSNYTDSLAEYWPQVLRSFVYALIATAAALISYPLAYFIGVKMRGRPVVQNLLMTLVIAPFFISFLLRTLAWKAILSDDGWIASSLKAVSILPPDAHITGTPFSVIFGLTYNFIPFMCLPLYSTLERLDIRLLEAGQDLYASPWTTFRKVTVPLSMPGIVSGTLLTFIPAAGDYINASQDFLGAADTSMIGNVIESNFLVLQNYPTAAAMSVVLMAVILVIVGVYVRRSGTEELL
jgi:spermidine/putrescine transport system permease protein